MRYLTKLSMLVLLAVFMSVQPASADTRYVSDQLIITLRQGKSTKHRILTTLKSGTPLEVLEEGDSYFKVRTTDGVEGYVLRQYISSTPPIAKRVDELESRNRSLQNKIISLEKIRDNQAVQLKSLQEDYSLKFSEISSSTAELEENLEQALSNERLMTEKYDTLLAQAENVIEIAAERDRLQQNNIRLEGDVAALLTKNDNLADSRMIKWFLAGGGVFFFGWIIGRISRKKRRRF